MPQRGKRCLITGGAGGIGQALASECLSRGWEVAIADADLAVTTAAAERLGQSHGRKVGAIAADLRGESAPLQISREAQELLGRVDLLINNAGCSMNGSIEELEWADYAQAMAINVIAPAEIVRHCLPMMPHGAAILNVSSMLAQLGAPRSGAYAASKAALLRLSESMAAELKPRGISVTVALPGGVRSGIDRNMKFGKGVTESDQEKLKALSRRAMRLEPSEAARKMIQATCSRRQRIDVGIDAGALAIACRIAPSLIVRLMASAKL